VEVRNDEVLFAKEEFGTVVEYCLRLDVGDIYLDEFVYTSREIEDDVNDDIDEVIETGVEFNAIVGWDDRTELFVVP
jgi:hypothetical protein